mgnify:CR=1 FL=1
MGKANKETLKKNYSADRERILFTLAFPSNRKQYEQAFEDLYSSLRSAPPKPAFKKSFAKATGAGTAITGSFSFDIAKWLAENYPGMQKLKAALQILNPPGNSSGRYCRVPNSKIFQPVNFH